MYTRVPDKKPSAGTVKIPENYSGNAFSPKSLEVTEERFSPPIEIDDSPPVTKSLPNSDKALENTIPETQKASSERSILPSLFPSKSLKNHFPFGHGIGSEELLILGVMSIIFFSDQKEPDGELIMLLALLLFSG